MVMRDVHTVLRHLSSIAIIYLPLFVRFFLLLDFLENVCALFCLEMTTSSSRFFTSNFDPIPRSDLKFKRKFYIPSKNTKKKKKNRLLKAPGAIKGR